MKGSVRKRGKTWSYYFSYKIDGAYKKKEKGGFATKKEAEAALREALHQYDTNNIVKQYTTYTLYEYIIYWLQEEAPRTLKPRSIKIYTDMANQHIKSEIGHIKLTEVNTVMLYRFLNEKQKKYSMSTVSSIRNVLNNSFNHAIKEGIIHNNPCYAVKLNSKAYNTERLHNKNVLTKEQIDTLLQLAKETKLNTVPIYMPILISVMCGLRRSEVLALTWEDIDLENHTLRVDKILEETKTGIKFSTPKTASSIRIIKMPHDLVEELKLHQNQQNTLKQLYGDYYFKEYNFVCSKKDGSPISPRSSFNNAIRRFMEKVPFKFRFHDLRHTHATLMLEAGANPKAIQKRLGHSSINTTLNVYSHATDNMEDEAIKQFENIFK